jgi:hypothetical protein
MPTPSDAVSTYILAKDGNRPFLMRRAFAENAELEMVVKTDAISFPSLAKGVSAIDSLGRVLRAGWRIRNNPRGYVPGDMRPAHLFRRPFGLFCESKVSARMRP